MKRSDVTFLEVITVEDAHEEAIHWAGGSPGVRDRGLLESAVYAPVNGVFYFGSLAELAAAYAHGIAKNHPFVDGNKRAAFYATVDFLRLNGFSVKLRDDAKWIAIFEGIASGAVTRESLATEIALAIGHHQGAVGPVFVDFEPEDDEDEERLQPDVFEQREDPGLRSRPSVIDLLDELKRVARDPTKIGNE